MIKEIEKSRLHIKLLTFYVMLLPISTSLSGLIGSVSFINYVAVAYILAALFGLNFKIRIFSKNRLIFIYFAYFLISLLWNRYINFNWYVITTMMNMLITYIALSDRYSDKELKLLKKSIVISFIILLVLALFNIESIKSYRLTIKLFSEMDPNDFACGLVLIIALSLENILHKREIFKSIILLILSGMIIIFSGSRGAMLMFIGMFISWIFISSKKRRGFTIITISVMAIGLYIVYGFLPEYLQGRLDILGAISKGGSGRTAIWNAGLVKFSESNPLRMLFGYGYGSFAKAVNYIAPGHTEPYISHNMFINALVEGGLIGFVIIMMLFTKMFLYANRKKNMFGVLALIGLAISGCTLDTQAYRIFAVVFIFTSIFSGGQDERISKHEQGVHNHSRIQC